MFDLVPFSKKQSNIARSSDLFNIEDIFDNFFNDRFFPSLYKNSAQMRVDIRENEKDYVLEAELPGVKKDEINIDLNEDQLTISVQKSSQLDEENNNYIRRERNYSTITRSFAISNIDNDKVSAKFEDGILILTLPKKDTWKKKGKQIRIE
ncbi:Hsp20/alpha crystallin family protein [Desulfosporosinus sp. PR]|uniref:Hsp20/alpha crystallin family protein n=1 Tax=Candidatus Desulfosporosinus nitrosoreducens TaxID=3401928 RepID=UPI0027FB00D8|nr:Hsp20/alpha crystallin family protein [Desulfosporosinus sp. PR]MDQ7092304.1 Hsp20/alpha crystallin family protein [Desulfosporosinus sp. PR]